MPTVIYDGKKSEKWIIKKKFMFAGVALLVITLIAFKGIMVATTVAHIAVLLTAYTTASGTVLALVFAADVTDKKLNNGKYNNQSDNHQ